MKYPNRVSREQIKKSNTTGNDEHNARNLISKLEHKRRCLTTKRLTNCQNLSFLFHHFLSSLLPFFFFLFVAGHSIVRYPTTKRTFIFSFNSTWDKDLICQAQHVCLTKSKLTLRLTSWALIKARHLPTSFRTRPLGVATSWTTPRVTGREPSRRIGISWCSPPGW